MNPYFKSALGVLALGCVTLVSANELTTATKKAISTHTNDAASQRKIDGMELSGREASEQYLTNQRLADVTEAYNQQIAVLVESQTREIADLEKQIASIEETDQAVLPMLSRMVETLAKFVEADLPFLPDEREKRIAKLQQLLQRADVSVAEKYRQILEAYSVEVQYGRTFEAYRGSLSAGQQVHFLRLGRTALYYQTLNGHQSAMWQPKQGSWKPLSDPQNLTITKALQIAQQQQVPSLLDLPLPALER